jgi:hypothetical protein
VSAVHTLVSTKVFRQVVESGIARPEPCMSPEQPTQAFLDEKRRINDSRIALMLPGDSFVAVRMRC